MMTPDMVTTGFEIPGLNIARNVGVVRGIVVRSRSVVGNIAGAAVRRPAVWQQYLDLHQPLRAHAHRGL